MKHVVGQLYRNSRSEEVDKEYIFSHRCSFTNPCSDAEHHLALLHVPEYTHNII